MRLKLITAIKQHKNKNKNENNNNNNNKELLV